MTQFDKETLAPFFEEWEAIREDIAALYAGQDRQVIGIMTTAIEKYQELLEYGGQEPNERTGKIDYILLPLNGEERFEFVKAKIASHYAYVQLDALYTETKKKVARLAIRKR
ncbi:YpoC family protein [Sporosarcina sp. FSL K6-1522]|uniref:YpoC family protein n=1 Tax=Sporosarcina sp. FSL K6-1522 TaxID=2921554 RepID=UPI003159C8B7